MKADCKKQTSDVEDLLIPAQLRGLQGGSAACRSIPSAVVWEGGTGLHSESGAGRF